MFKVKHLMITNVKGEFKSFTAHIDHDDFTKSKVSVNIDATSIFTNNTDRDNHLKSADFFDVEQFPVLTFESSSMKKLSDDEFKLTGVLTVKGVSKEITLDVEFGGTNKDPWGNEKAGFSFEAKINRKDWGLNWNAALETGGVLVSDEVKLVGEVQFVKQV
jgi:polyisoprenoid-binding protein YceI